VAFTLEAPYPIYRLLNAFLLSAERQSDTVTTHVAPYFVRFYRALEKLPRKKVQAWRAVTVVPGTNLQFDFNSYDERFRQGNRVNFWNVTSFTAKEKVAHGFAGTAQDLSITYVCDELDCASMSLFSSHPLEHEIMPLPPACFESVSATKPGGGNKVVVSLKQLPHSKSAYLDPK